jgi:hypothetical protein
MRSCVAGPAMEVLSYVERIHYHINNCQAEKGTLPNPRKVEEK